ncbi:MAG: hypothetical protein AAGA88_09365 [Pseudomonadota bacterium]
MSDILKKWSVEAERGRLDAALNALPENRDVVKVLKAVKALTEGENKMPSVAEVSFEAQMFDDKAVDTIVAMDKDGLISIDGDFKTQLTRMGQVALANSTLAKKM